jgi:hypothetical protein
MTEGVRRRADDGARRRPLARVALLAIPGGTLIGALIGSLVPLAVLVPDLVFNPSQLGGTGSPGYALIGSQVGFLIGSFFGTIVGTVTAGAVALAWRAGLPRWAVATIGGAVVTVVVFGAEVGLIGHDLQTVSVALIGSVYGVGGVILLAWIGELR